jgi:hypothetical protein
VVNSPSFRGSASAPITVRRDGQDLIVTEEEAGGVLRLQLVDKDHLTMVDEMHKLTIPLKRR